MKENTIKVERETYEKNGKTNFTYFIKGIVRGKDVRIAVVPPDFGGYNGNGLNITARNRFVIATNGKIVLETFGYDPKDANGSEIVMIDHTFQV